MKELSGNLKDVGIAKRKERRINQLIRGEALNDPPSRKEKKRKEVRGVCPICATPLVDNKSHCQYCKNADTLRTGKIGGGASPIT